MDDFKQYVGIFLLLIGLVACSQSAELPEHDKSEIYAELPYNWVAQMEFAASDFKSTDAYKNYQKTKHGEYCFKIETYREEDKFYIDILPRFNVVEKDGVMVLDPKADDYCGRGISYEFDELGQFLRKIHQR